MRRVVITGLGLVCPLGVGVEKSWQKLIEGRSGIRRISQFDITDVASKVGGSPLLDPLDPDYFDFSTIVDHKERRRIDNFILYALTAAKEAIEDSGISLDSEEDRCQTGVLIGSGVGGLNSIEENARLLFEKGPRRVSPFFIPSILVNLASGYVSIRYGLKGPNHSVVTACATGSHSIGDAANLIRLGMVNTMVAGGAEGAMTRLGYAGFSALRALSTAYNDCPQEASRPWDQGRDGFVMGEGAGIVVLESYEQAKKRGAKIYGEVAGYGLSGDANHITAPSLDGDGAFRAMKSALSFGKINVEDIDYVNAHGTSTQLGDKVEIAAVKRLFGANVKNLLMSSTKSSIGHLLGAAGSVEAIFSLLAMRDGLVPPTLNLHAVGEGCEGIDLVALKTKEKKLKYVLSNSFGFGGTNASLILKKVEAC